MSTATLERKGGAASPAEVVGLEHKAAPTVEKSLAPKSGVLKVDPERGVVTAIVSVTGIVDNVNDRILPGAYTKTLKKRKAKGVWSHDWKDWVSRTETIEEYLPGDSRLPSETKDGKPWPKEAGALVVTTRFNMKSDRSKEAFLAVEFFSETDECEWSIGYVVPPGAATKDKDGVRNIKTLELFEYSPVLFGAASESMTLSVKSAGGAISVDAAKHAETIADLRGSALGDAVALDDGSLRISRKSDITEALRAYPTAPDRVEAKAHIIARAARLGALDALPKGWAPEAKGTHEVGDDEANSVVADSDLDLADADLGEDDEPLSAAEEALLDTPEAKAFIADLEAKYNTAPVGTPGGRQNWVDNVGGLPKFIRAIAHALIRKGMSKGRAIATAVNTVKRWAAGGKGVSAKTQAKAAKALAEWEAKKVRSKGKGGKKSAGGRVEGLLVEPVEAKAAAYDPTLESKDPDPGADLDMKYYGAPSLPGTYEERMQALREAVNIALRGQKRKGGDYPRYEWDDTSIVGTYDDHVIATRYKYGEPGPTVPESFSIDYTWDGEEITLGDPEPVKLSVVTVVGEAKGVEPVDSFIGLPDMLSEVTEGVKAFVAAAPEYKAGRVLSNANETRLRAAAEHLFAVLRAAGIKVQDPGEPRMDKPDTLHDGEPDSTAPSAAATGGETLKVKARFVDGVLVIDDLPAEPEKKSAQPKPEPQVKVEGSVEEKILLPSPADVIARLREGL